MRNYIFVFLLIGIVTINYSQDISRQWLGLTYEALDLENSRLNLSQLLRWRSGNFNQVITEADFKTDLFGNPEGWNCAISSISIGKVRCRETVPEVEFD
jgi:hypothetical protein